MEGAKKARRADTNILCVKFNKLTEPSHVHAGDAVTCSNLACAAVLSFVSKVTSTDGSAHGEKVTIYIISWHFTFIIFFTILHNFRAPYINNICRLGFVNFVVLKITLT